MPALPFIDADALRAVPIGDLIDAIEQAYRDVATGRDASPERLRVPMPHGDLLLMPGLRREASGASVKLVTVTPRNATRGLATVQALVVWLDVDSGAPRALLDGAELTAMRTGAGTGAATRLLARSDASVLAMIGAGAQAEWQVRAVLAVRPIREVRVYARGPSRDALVERLAGQVEAVAVATAAQAIEGADIICCATSSSEPVFAAEAVGPGRHVNAIGAFRPDMVELPSGLFARAAVVSAGPEQLIATDHPAHARRNADASGNHGTGRSGSASRGARRRTGRPGRSSSPSSAGSDADRRHRPGERCRPGGSPPDRRRGRYP